MRMRLPGRDEGADRQRDRDDRATRRALQRSRGASGHSGSTSRYSSVTSRCFFGRASWSATAPNSCAVIGKRPATAGLEAHGLGRCRGQVRPHVVAMDMQRHRLVGAPAQQHGLATFDPEGRRASFDATIADADLELAHCRRRAKQGHAQEDDCGASPERARRTPASRRSDVPASLAASHKERPEGKSAWSFLGPFTHPRLKRIVTRFASLDRCIRARLRDLASLS